MTHDPFCPAHGCDGKSKCPDYGNCDGCPSRCICDLIAKVREDERDCERIKQIRADETRQAYREGYNDACRVKEVGNIIWGFAK